MKKNVVTVKFCTCHDSIAVMACAKFHCDSLPWIYSIFNWYVYIPSKHAFRFSVRPPEAALMARVSLGIIYIMITTEKLPPFWCLKLERLRSEIPPPPSMITHTSVSHQIPCHKKTKSKLQILKICQNFKIWNLAMTLTRNASSEVAW